MESFNIILDLWTLSTYYNLESYYLHTTMSHGVKYQIAAVQEDEKTFTNDIFKITLLS